jgi:hypothetical protein
MKRRKGKKHIVETLENYGFKDTKYLCACIVVDISNYTNTTLPLSFQPDKHEKYHSIFYNTMEAIARNFGAEVVKTGGSGKVIFFFLKTSKPSSDYHFTKIHEYLPDKDPFKYGYPVY